MPPQEKIKAILAAEVERTTACYRVASKEFQALMERVPSERPYLGVLFPLTELEREKCAAIKALCEAVQRYDDFVLRGKIPDDLVNTPQIQN